MLQIKDFSKSYEKVLFSNINLSLKPHELIYLKGRSGSGKSQFLKGIVGLIPISGTVTINTKVLCPVTLRSKVLYVSQFTPQESISVGEYLNSIRAFKVYSNRSFSFKEFLAKFELTETFLSKRFSLLSGGEKQIISLVRALAINPDYLLLDEPVASMDSHTKEMALSVLQDYLNDGGGILMTTHEDLSLAGRVFNL